MQFIRICDDKYVHLLYQTNQLVSVEPIEDKLWVLTFSDNKKYKVIGGDYFCDFEFMQNPTKPIYDLKVK